MNNLILQNVSTKEIRTVVQAVALSDKNEYNVIRSDMDHLSNYSEELKTAVPIGSVEFVRKAMEIAGIQEPCVDPYPLFIEEEKTVFKRKIQIQKVFPNDLSDFEGMFVKPFKVKQFTGFVYTSENCEEFIEEQKNTFSKIRTYVWVSDVVDFIGEWRYYIQNEKIIGYARYDDDDENPEELQEPDRSLIKEYIAKLEIKHPYVLDFGILSTGETALVEFNDFWAIGLYENAITPKQYLECLIERWKSICEQSKTA
nr:MAG: hypothetical protein [Caudoviricetes sp.]